MITLRVARDLDGDQLAQEGAEGLGQRAADYNRRRGWKAHCVVSLLPVKPEPVCASCGLLPAGSGCDVTGSLLYGEKAGPR